MIMRRENGWCNQFCIFAICLLYYSATTQADEGALERVPYSTRDVTTPADVTTIRATVQEVITDDDILIDPTSISYLEQITSLVSTVLLDDDDDEDLSEVKNVTYGIDPLLITTSEENQTESSISSEQSGENQAFKRCSNYVTEKNVVDLALDGNYRPKKYDILNRENEGAKNVATSTLDDSPPFVYVLEGDYTITLITDQADFGACLFTVDRINELQLINGDGTLGLRIVLVQNVSNAQRVLEEEVNHLRECSTNSIGIFVAQHIWPHLRVDSLGSNVFPFPSPNDMLYAKAAHLLYELPWSNPNSSIAVRSESAESSNKFTEICRKEHLCLENFPSDDTIFIILGLTKSVSFATNGTLIVVLSGQDMLFISDLPDMSYVIAENEINLVTLENQLNISAERYGSKILASDVLLSGSVFLEAIELLNLPSDKNCSMSGKDRCEGLNDTLVNWKYYAKLSSQRIVSELRLDNLTQHMTFELRQKFNRKMNNSDGVLELKPIASSNLVTNVTTVYRLNDFKEKQKEPTKLGNIFYCTKEFEFRHPDFRNRHKPIYYGNDYVEMYWQIKQEAWVAAGLTVASLGILFCLAILIFLIIRVCMDDVMEGNPLGSMLLLVSLIFQFASFLPFSIEYTGYMPDLLHSQDTIYTWNTLCTFKIFLVSFFYCTTFSLLLCRAIMLASIGSEGGFLSHVNGYLQSVICTFSTLVQLGLSTQLVFVLHVNSHNISCNQIYYGNWFWAVIAYDGVLLAALVFLSPFIFRSQRNYREGLLLVTGSILCLVIWTTWIPLCMFGYEFREAAISLGMVATALAVLVGIMIPRCFLMVRSIARSDLVQALPSLTSLAFAQANQYISEQSVYECVNPAMRQQRSSTTETFMEHEIDEPYMATSEIPTLPLRGNRRSQYQETNGSANGSTHFYGISNPYNSCSDSITSELSPNKITRF